jgi:hypothetical protein
MRIGMPASLAREHEELKQALLAGSAEKGPIGEALSRLSGLLAPHLRKEESFAMPPLGLLARLARGDINPGMAQVLPHCDWMRNNLAALVAEHRAIAAAAEELAQVAREARRADYAEFAQRLLDHARMEEEVIYPAAVLVGEYLRLRLASEAQAVLP